jgi:hypothetical protein
MRRLRVLSIDPGTRHFSYIVAECRLRCNNLWYTESLLHAGLYDITNFVGCKEALCELQHTNCITDYMSHVFQSVDYFTTSDVIVCEEQPPSSAVVAVQELIRNNYRQKTEMSSPLRLQRYFHWQKEYTEEEQFSAELRREKRKLLSVTLARRIISSVPENHIELDDFTRKHDVADAICQYHYWLCRKNDLQAIVIPSQKKSRYF